MTKESLTRIDFISFYFRWTAKWITFTMCPLFPVEYVSLSVHSWNTLRNDLNWILNYSAGEKTKLDINQSVFCNTPFLFTEYVKVWYKKFHWLVKVEFNSPFIPQNCPHAEPKLNSFPEMYRTIKSCYWFAWNWILTEINTNLMFKQGVDQEQSRLHARIPSTVTSFRTPVNRVQMKVHISRTE